MDDPVEDMHRLLLMMDDLSVYAPVIYASRTIERDRLCKKHALNSLQTYSRGRVWEYVTRRADGAYEALYDEILGDALANLQELEAVGFAANGEVSLRSPDAVIKVHFIAFVSGFEPKAVVVADDGKKFPSRIQSAYSLARKIAKEG